MKVFIGLGNPDKKYEKTYHNVGFIFVDKLAEELGASFSKEKYKARYAEINYGGEKIIFLKPQTYMNKSGDTVVLLLNSLKLNAEDIYICLDDIDLEDGKYRYRENGSAGTHNGLRDIIARAGSENFRRIRFGIGRDERMDLADYVLSNISNEKYEKIKNAMDEALEFVMKKILKE